MSATEIARKTLAPGEGHYEKLTPDEIYSLCCAVQDAEAYRARVEGVAKEMLAACDGWDTPITRGEVREWSGKLTEKGNG